MISNDSFTKIEILAFLKIFKDVCMADGKVSKGEIELLNLMAMDLDFNLDEIIDSHNISFELAEGTLRGMSDEKKKYFSYVIKRIATVDGELEVQAMKQGMDFLVKIGINPFESLFTDE